MLHSFHSIDLSPLWSMGLFISLSESLSLVYRKTTGFYILVLYSAASMNSFILIALWWSLYGHLQVGTLLLLAFKSGCLYFLLWSDCYE